MSGIEFFVWNLIAVGAGVVAGGWIERREARPVLSRIAEFKASIELEGGDTITCDVLIRVQADGIVEVSPVTAGTLDPAPIPPQATLHVQGPT